MLSAQQLDSIANKINASVDLPFIGEDTEKALIGKVVGSLGGVLGGILNPEQQAALADPNKGIELGEAGKNDLMSQLMSKLPLGGLSDSLSGGVSKIITDMLAGAMQKGGKL
ncbi:MAG: hypothetical protein MUC97_13615 [Bernardetiaceae bacterium]|jgi:hypothetical protein|nr:hypothetical protein [Bernardetiaceae bacterium]